MQFEWTGSVIAIDGGGSGHRAALYAPDAREPRVTLDGPPLNAITLGAHGLVARAASTLRHCMDAASPPPGIIALGCAGCANRAVRGAVLEVFINAYPAVMWAISDDITPVLESNAPDFDALLVTAGTGSGVWRKAANGAVQRWGGLGPILGDPGSAYALGIAGLRCALEQGLARDSSLLQLHLLRRTGCEADLNIPGYVQRASVHDVAALAEDVIALAEQGEPNATALVQHAVQGLASLAADAASGCARATPIFMAGGLLLKSSYYRARFLEAAETLMGPRDMRMAGLLGPEAVHAWLKRGAPGGDAVSRHEGLNASASSRSGRVALPATEARHQGPALDTLSPTAIVETMSAEDGRAVRAVREQGAIIARLMQHIAEAFQREGRLIYLGAGTSGRLGVLDASECVPTFGVPPGQVIGLIAGGAEALTTSVEGAEDDRAAGLAAIAALAPQLSRTDVVVGISASGTTPFVHGGLEAAHEMGVLTGLIHCNPGVTAAVDLEVALATGPEALPGSTRLKAGTATKLVLNMLTTGAMALSGRIYEGYMVGVTPVNTKLQARAARILAALTTCDQDEASAVLEAAEFVLPVALIMVRKKCSREEAANYLQEAGGHVRQALAATEEDPS